MINLSSFIRYHASRTPERTAIVYNNEHISYLAFMERIETMAGWLARKGIGVGDVVALLMKNSPAFLEAAFGVSHLGAIFLPINFRLSPDEVGYIVDNAGAKLLLADEELASSAPGGVAVQLVDTAAQQDSRTLTRGAPPAPMQYRVPGDLFR